MPTQGAKVQRLPDTETLRSVGMPVTSKVQLFAQSKNQLLIRLTNYADKFDGDQETPYVNITAVALALYQLANPLLSAPKVDITETSLTGNQPYSSMQGSKIPWKGVDDASIVEPTLP